MLFSAESTFAKFLAEHPKLDRLKVENSISDQGGRVRARILQ
jgi:hypothetical protein